MDKFKKYLAELMAQGLSTAEISRKMKDFMRTNFPDDQFVKEVLKSTDGVSVLDVKSREALQEVYKSVSQDYAKAKNKIVSNVAREVQIGIQQNLKTHEIAARIANIQGTFRSYHKTIARTGVAGFNNAFMVDKAGDGARFKYSGGAAERSFCKDMLARSANGETWTREEIEQMSNGQGSNPMYFCGGYNCKHRWLKVTDVNEKPKEKDVRDMTSQELSDYYKNRASRVQTQSKPSMTEEQARKKEAAWERAQQRKKDKKNASARAEWEREKDKTPEQRAAMAGKIEISSKLRPITEFYATAEKMSARAYIEAAAQNLTGFPQQVAQTVAQYGKASPKQLEIIVDGCYKQDIFEVSPSGDLILKRKKS